MSAPTRDEVIACLIEMLMADGCDSDRARALAEDGAADVMRRFASLDEIRQQLPLLAKPRGMTIEEVRRYVLDGRLVDDLERRGKIPKA